MNQSINDENLRNLYNLGFSLLLAYLFISSIDIAYIDPTYDIYKIDSSRFITHFKGILLVDYILLSRDHL